MWIQYLLTALLLVAVIVFVFRNSFGKKEKYTVPKKGKKIDFIPKDAALTVDDKYNLDKKQKELELNKILDKVANYGYDKLSEKEKSRLSELSDNL